MAIPYYLVDNALTENPNDFRGVLGLKGVKTELDIVVRILKNNVGISEAEILAVLKQEQSAIKEFLEDGYKVDAGLFAIKPTMKGVFDSAKEIFTDEKHALRFRIAPRKALKAILKNISLVKVVNGGVRPVITVFEDMISKTNDDTITPGKTAKLFGDKLKFDVEDVEQGIFFIKDKYKDNSNRKHKKGIISW